MSAESFWPPKTKLYLLCFGDGGRVRHNLRRVVRQKANMRLKFEIERSKFREKTFQKGAEQISARNYGSKGWFMLSVGALLKRILNFSAFFSEDVCTHKLGEFLSRVQLKLCSNLLTKFSLLHIAKTRGNTYGPGYLAFLNLVRGWLFLSVPRYCGKASLNI